MDERGGKMLHKLLKLKVLQANFEQMAHWLGKGAPDISEVFHLSPEEMHQRELKARHLFDCQEFEMAVVDFTELTRANPLNGHYWQLLATAQSRAGQLEPALTSFTICWLLNPSDPTPLYHTALCQIRLERDEEARKSLEQVVTIANQDHDYRAVEDQAQNWLNKLG